MPHRPFDTGFFFSPGPDLKKVNMILDTVMGIWEDVRLRTLRRTVGQSEGTGVSRC